MKKVLIICGSIYLTIILSILIAGLTDEYGLLIAIVLLLVFAGALIIYDIYILRSIQKISINIQLSTDYERQIQLLNDILKKPLTKDQVLKTQFLLVIAYTYLEGGLTKAKEILSQMDIPLKKRKYAISKMDCLLGIYIVEEDEKEYFKTLEKEKEFIDYSSYENNKKILTYYFQLLKDFYQPSLEKEVKKIIKEEKDSGISTANLQFYNYLNLLKFKVNGMPLTGIDELMKEAKGTYLIEKLELLKNSEI